MKTKKLVTILLVLGCFMAVAGTSSANVISFSDNVNFDHDQIVNTYVYDCPGSLTYTFLSDTVSLSQFDPGLGILNSVELIVESTIDVETYYWYAYPSHTTSQWWYSNVIGSVNGLQATISQEHNHHTTGTGYHDHAFSIDGTASESASSGLAAFIGTGQVDVAITGNDKLCAWWNYYDHIDTDTNGTVTATLTYNYTPLPVKIDIKPGSCPNPLNPKSKGVLPVAVLGSEDFDVTTIDVESVALSLTGVEPIVAPIRHDYEDVATPFDGELCDCHDLDGDGYLDLTLKFSTSELVETLGLEDFSGETIPLTLTGNLMEEEGGTAIEGQDCIRVK